LLGFALPNVNDKELTGISLNVYLYVAKKGNPVGPRDVVKGAHLSSPSVAYRHLEKLEEMGYLQKNAYGEYITKDRPPISGFVWAGKWLTPKMTVYSLIFLSILIVELFILAVHWAVENYEFKIFFLLLTMVTGSAATVFAAEGLLQRKRLKQIITSE
jgi:hypothetical protein